MNYQTKILVIEDDIQLGKTIMNLLIVHGYDVCYVNNGASGIQKAFEYNPDLILCDIRMDPIDGFQVFNVLKESTLVDRIPFIFITGSSDIQDIRFGLDLGADDYFVKPFENENLINAIEKRLNKFQKLKEIGKREFRALFNLTPNGIFLFDGYVIFEANQSLLKMLDIQKDNITSYSIEDFLDALSYQKIKAKITRCMHELMNSFSETVSFGPINGEMHDATLHVSVYEKYSGYSLMMGLVALSNKKSEENEVFISDVLNVLKRENIVVTQSLGEELAKVFSHNSIDIKPQNNSVFSYRENQVLCLAMEGLPIKMIADKLSISDRTVEKHRARLMEKTGTSNMIEVIIYALRNNLINI